MIIDLPELDWIEIKIHRHADGARIWIDSSEGFLLRAYRVKRILLQQDDDPKESE